MRFFGGEQYHVGFYKARKSLQSAMTNVPKVKCVIICPMVSKDIRLLQLEKSRTICRWPFSN